MKDKERNIFEEKKVIADEVADEILAERSNDDTSCFPLILIFLVCLVFLIASVSFAIFNTVVNNNAVDVDINVNKPDVDINKRPNKNNNNKPDNNGNNTNGNSNDNSKNDSNKDNNSKNPSISKDLVLFTFSSGSNYINMQNVFSMSDVEGIALKGDKEYFDFNVSASLNSKKKGSIVYEISLVPLKDNTISEDFIRVYLTENDSPVSVLSDNVSNFSDLPKSKFSSNGRVIYKKTVNSSFNGNYVFKMWVSSKADFSNVSKKFGCRVMVNAYYK